MTAAKTSGSPRFQTAGKGVDPAGVVGDRLVPPAHDQMTVGRFHRGADADGVGHYVRAVQVGKLGVGHVGAEERLVA